MLIFFANVDGENCFTESHYFGPISTDHKFYLDPILRGWDPGCQKILAASLIWRQFELHVFVHYKISISCIDVAEYQLTIIQMLIQFESNFSAIFRWFLLSFWSIFVIKCIGRYFEIYARVWIILSPWC